MRQTLQKVGRELVLRLPAKFIEQNQLRAGSQVELRIAGNKLTIEVRDQPRCKLADLLAEMPDCFPRAEGWDEMPDAGNERG